MNTMIGRLAAAALALLCLTCLPARANIVIEGSRVIYPAQATDVSVRVFNRGAQPMLLQSWLHDGPSSEGPESASAPFLVTPVIARIEPGAAQTLRIVPLPAELPQQRESVFYLNVLSVPPKPADQPNAVQIGLRTAIKLFYRPARLAGTPSAAHQSLTWKLVPDGQGYALQAHNPSAYHVSFANFRLQVGNQSVRDVGGGMVAPGGTQVFHVPNMSPHLGQASAVFYTWINDWGALHEAPLTIAR